MAGLIKYLAAAVFLALFAAPAGAFAAGPGDGEPASGLRVIVIDPGHGGEVTGAIGSRGRREKDITLAVAKELRGELEKAFNARVVLTREDDTYVTLEERTALANREKADVFISIHANAAQRKGASGVETYFMSMSASDAASEKLAAVENNPALADEAGGEPPDILKSILWDLVKNEAHHESARLAEAVHESLINVTGGVNRGVKQAPFMVLAGADMPAVLVEVGFISNPGEARRLASAKAHAIIASSITRGVVEFESELKKRAGRPAPGRGTGSKRAAAGGGRDQAYD